MTSSPHPPPSLSSHLANYRGCPQPLSQVLALPQFSVCCFQFLVEQGEVCLSCLLGYLVELLSLKALSPFSSEQLLRPLLLGPSRVIALPFRNHIDCRTVRRSCQVSMAKAVPFLFSEKVLAYLVRGLQHSVAFVAQLLHVQLTWGPPLEPQVLALQPQPFALEPTEDARLAPSRRPCLS